MKSQHRKAAEEKRKREEAFNAYLDASLELDVMRDTDWFTTAVNEAKARVSQWPPELQQVASASLPSLEQQLAHEKRQADRIAELERENEALRKDAARYRWLRAEAIRDYIEFRDVWYEDGAALDGAVDNGINGLLATP